METLEKIRNIYTEILETVKKHKDDVVYDINKLEEEANIHIFGVELKEKYGLNIDPKKIYSLKHVRLGDFKYIWSLSNIKDTVFENICSDIIIKNENLPGMKSIMSVCTAEYVFILYFPTGAFIFSSDGKEYPKEFYEKFWEELKEYNPDYEDYTNHQLCWELENAKEIFNSFENLLNKYYELNKKRIKEEKIKKLKIELDNLQNG